MESCQICYAYLYKEIFKRIFVPRAEKKKNFQDGLLTLSNNQPEAILLQEITNHTEFKFPNFKSKISTNHLSY